MQYQHTLSAKAPDWRETASALLEQGKKVLLIDVNEHTLAECINLSQQFNYRFIHESAADSSSLPVPTRIGLVPNQPWALPHLQ